MKKLLIIFAIGTLLLGGCGKKGEENVVLNTPEPSSTPFEEVQKVEMEVSDYVDETFEPAASEKPNENKETDTDKAWDDKSEQVNSDTDNNTSVNKEDNTDVDTNVNSDSAVENKVSIEGKIICIDPGHGKFSQNRTEPLAPNTTASKPAFKEGTKGRNSIEDTVNLAVALKLKSILEEKGATVIMTRTDENNDLSNVERAKFANDNNADISVKLHADGTQEGGSGMTALYPGTRYVKNSQMVADSKRLARLIINSASKKTGARNRGIYANSQMSGLNWSEVPVVLFEMGFMTNRNDEAKLNDESYQSLIAEGIAEGIMNYFAN